MERELSNRMRVLLCLIASSFLTVASAAAVVGLDVDNNQAATVINGQADLQAASTNTCSTERQTVHCSHLGAKHRIICCQLFVPVAAGPSNQRIGSDLAAVAQSEAVALARTSKRVDLHPMSRPSFDHLHPECFVPVQLPAIPQSSREPVLISTQFAPRLSTEDIKQVKAQAVEQLPRSIKNRMQRLNSVSKVSGFVHPAALAGPAELVLMQERLQEQKQPQWAAQRALLSGGGVRPKFYTVPETGRPWAPPTDCPPEGYRGPYAVREIDIDWGGVDFQPAKQRPCSESFDPRAPQQLCGHLSFVELDAVMAYKQAVAWWATGDSRHAQTALDIIAAWARTNSHQGVKHRNGPLEAGWATASMARALELLRNEAPPELITDFINWVNTQLMPQMDYFIDESDLGTLHSNFHAAIVDAMVAVAVLSNDRARWEKAHVVFDATVQRYLRWGKDIWAEGHVLGEVTETQRDIYHTQMGLAGLLQAAEMAWQQDEDWYSSNDHALAAAVELHARIVRAAADRDEQMLPQGFRFFESMPRPPMGTFWKFDLERQIWAAHNSTTSVRVMDKTKDDFKYMVGAEYLPAGWELGYNHYANRLGLRMPETAALLKRMWPEWYELYFGLGTLTHGHTAADLWVTGIKAGFKECASR